MRARLAALFVLGGSIVGVGCHDFSEVNFGRVAVDSGTDAGPEASCSGLLVAMADGTEACKPTPRSCQDLPATCGPAAESCCQYSPSLGSATSSETFSRGYDRSLPGGATQDGVTITGTQPLGSALAHLSPYFLERYEVTIGRFRRFYDNYGSLKTDYTRSGVGAYPPSQMSNGWDITWNSNAMLLAQSQMDLLTAITSCDTDIASALASPSSARDDEPMSCVTWYESFLFCAWDGGHLPSEAQWNFAAAGGTEGRPYPWVPLDQPDGHLLEIPAGYANVAGVGPGTVLSVGTGSKPGRWGHYDLAGNVWEYVLDACAGTCGLYTGE
jgi:sulfatase modifying factor 1